MGPLGWLHHVLPLLLYIAACGEEPLPKGAIARLGSPVSGFAEGVSGLEFSPDGRALVAASTNGRLCLWSLATMQPHWESRAPGGGFHAVDFSPGGNLIASAGEDGKIHLHDPTTGKETRILEGHAASVLRLAFDPGGKRLASADKSGAVRVWDLTDGSEQSSWSLGGQIVWDLSWSEDGSTLNSAWGDGTIRVNDPSTGQERARCTCEIPLCRAMALDSDARFVASVEEGFAVRLWDATTGQELAAWTGHERCTHSVVFSSDGRMVVSASKDRTIRIWEVASGRCALVLPLPQSLVWSVALSRDRALLAAGLQDGTVVLYELRCAPSSPASMEDAWEALAALDPVGGRAGIEPFVSAGDRGAEALNERLLVLNEAEVRGWIDALDDDEVTVREKATAELTRVRVAAHRLLREAAEANISAEARGRIRTIFEARSMPPYAGELLRSVRAIEALERIGTEPARRGLREIAEGPIAAPEVRAASSALRRLETARGQ